MKNIAILVGNKHYDHQNELSCCGDDLIAMQELLNATSKYDEIHLLQDKTSTRLKIELREALDKDEVVGELFFYFTGHGDAQQGDFYFCATDYESNRPNESGLSNSDLHTFLRLANAELVVKIIDACNSGTYLIKSDASSTSVHLAAVQKQGFKNLIQISSCLDNQNSLTGDPLSVFTESFRSASLRKLEGVVYYTDIISSLRDEYLQNNSTTPLYVSQGTGREQFTEDAKRLDGLRQKLAPATIALSNELTNLSSSKPTLKDLLQRAELGVVNPNQMKEFVNGFFESVTQRISASDFADFFELDEAWHADFHERTARSHMIRVLSKEDRPDQFVRAEIRQEKKRDPIGFAAMSVMSFMSGGDITETFELELNCSMEKAQLSIKLTPKFASLNQIRLILSCAPSLRHCYIFEIGTQHRLIDFGKYDPDGFEIVKRWYKIAWPETTDCIATNIAAKLSEVVQNYLDSTESKLGLQTK